MNIEWKNQSQNSNRANGCTKELETEHAVILRSKHEGSVRKERNQSEQHKEGESVCTN